MISRIESLPKLTEIPQFLRFVAERFQRDRCTQIAGSLTFTTLLSIVPLFTVLVSLLSAFPAFEDFMTQVKIWLLTNLVPEVAGKIITVYMTQFTENAGKLSAVGLSFLVVTAISLLMTIDLAFNSIWRVQRPRSWLLSMLVYWALITLGPFAIGLSLSVKVYLIAATQGVLDALPFGDWIALSLTPFLLEVLVLSLFYRIVPNRFLPLLHAIIGAAIAAAAFTLMKQMLAEYVRSVPTYSVVYGTFASIPILLLWLFGMWLVILLGAEVTAGLSQWRGSLRRLSVPSAEHPNGKRKPITEIQEVRFRHGLMLMKALVKAQHDGDTLTLKQLRATVHAPFDLIEDLLDALINAGMVEQTQRSSYVLVQRPSQVTLAQLYRLFVMSGVEISHDDYSDVSSAVVKALTERQNMLNVNLEQAFELTTKAPNDQSSIAPHVDIDSVRDNVAQ
jgi:membrane protein